MHPYSHSNHIDLTATDDEDDLVRSDADQRLSKRRKVEDAPPPPNYASQYGSFAPRGPSSTFYDPPPAPMHGPPRAPPMFSSQPAFIPNLSQGPSQLYRPPFAGPSNVAPHIPLPNSSPPNNSFRSSDSTPDMFPAHNSVIDLTGSPSPSPQPLPPSLPPVSHPQSSLPVDLAPKTPVCIGQLSVTALVLYPTDYLRPNAANPFAQGGGDWAPVRLQYERNVNRPGSEDTIHIKTPSTRTAAGESHPGDPFGVVEQKVASALGPMLGKGLIRLDAKVRRGLPNLPILPLQMLVFTPKGNIPVVGNYLRQSGLLLDHPMMSADGRICDHPYYNPHNPPPGGFHRNIMGSGRISYTGPGGSSQGRWTTPTVTGKSVEVQRSQVDELFKSLRGGDELEETEPPPQVGTQLYPHQKKALTFLLEREGEISRGDGKSTSLWQHRTSLSGENSWYHVVTQKEVFTEPPECKGAILADDMGLGKTITCLSLIAATLPSARAFASAPLAEPVPPPVRRPSESTLTAAHFAGSVWDMPDMSSSIASSKSKARETKAQDELDTQYVRACRIKTKSRATLIICPLSTVSNWEEQFREHWNGPVTVLGGSGASTSQTPQNSQASSSLASMTSLQCSLEGDVIQDVKPSVEPAPKAEADANALRVYVYHGNARRPDPTFLGNCDVVITTFSTLASEFSKQTRSLAPAADDDDDSTDSGVDGLASSMTIRLGRPKKSAKRKKPNTSNGVEISSPLQSVYWFRVVLDEAHSIKEISTVGCRASCDLMADRRLCLTGTPVQNKLDDVFALIKFLRLEPFDEKAVWTEYIGTPVKYGQPLGVVRLQTIMKCITLRRTKESKGQNGQRILSLPPRRDELRYLKFDEQEQGIYDQFFNESKAEFNELSDKNEVMKNYVGILQKILRLRQICDHFELVKGKGLIGDSQDPTASYDNVVKEIVAQGITPARAAIVFALLREASTTQCVECGYELSPSTSDLDDGPTANDGDGPPTNKRGRKPKGAPSRTATRANSPSSAVVQSVLTRCQHLFCICCYRRSLHTGWPKCSSDLVRPCPVCQTPLLPTDAAEINYSAVPTDMTGKQKSGKREKRTKGISMENFHPSTKVKALLGDLVQFSKANPYSANYDPSSLDIQMVDGEGNLVDDGVVKTVVFSQWTSMLDKIEDALEAAGIRYDRLDGTMKRDDRTRAMEALKHDPRCEVLLVSLKAGGVGLNLTAAQRVYLMDPYWNPAVENQAVDRIVRSFMRLHFLALFHSP
ncbi:hypothetical protein DENSPDRAFT_833051 [Dentipellis sp. KUC8613]|nr:hypothetical protein DENSPDRAFT_833051 [Dentipellis sp. KUC8613]